MAKFASQEDDAITVSARDWRAVREGETHAATRTSANNTPESLIVGVGASGTLLAGAAIVFITLVGLVSFNVWPSVGNGPALGDVELQAAKEAPAGGSAELVTRGSDQAVTAAAGGGGSQSGGGKPAGGGGESKGSKQPAPDVTPVSPPSSSEPGNDGANGGGGGNGNGGRNGNGNGGGNGNGASDQPTRAGRSAQSGGPDNFNPHGHAASVSGSGKETSTGGGNGHGRGGGGGSANAGKKAKGGGAASTTATGSGGNRQNPGRGH